MATADDKRTARYFGDGEKRLRRNARGGKLVILITVACGILDMPRQPHTEKRKLSRRQVLQRLIVLASTGAFGGLTLARLRDRPRVVVLPNAADRPAAILRPSTISRDEWGALPVNNAAPNEPGIYEEGVNPAGRYVYADELSDSYQTLVIHHSAFYKANGRETLLEVQRLHRDDRGWADVGYHYLVDMDGAIYEGRNLAVRGVHTQGRNTGSAGVCLLGDFRHRTPTQAQWDGLIALSHWLVAELALTHLAAHRQFNEGTLCPGETVLEQLPALAQLLGVDYGIEGYVPTADRGDSCPCQTPL